MSPPVAGCTADTHTCEVDWDDSPAGAYAPDPTLSGKANFGFVAKYKKGQSTPDGQTEFQFKAGDLNFHSTDYEWLVVAGKNAQFKGTGTINGFSNYGFMLTDVYDNKMGDPDDIDATDPQAIAGGSIVIHNK